MGVKFFLVSLQLNRLERSILPFDCGEAKIVRSFWSLSVLVMARFVFISGRKLNSYFPLSHAEEADEQEDVEEDDDDNEDDDDVDDVDSDELVSDMDESVEASPLTADIFGLS